MDNDRYMQALRQRSAVMPYGMPVSSDPEASDAYGEGVVRGVAKNLRTRAGDFINALRSPMETLGGIVETGKQIVRDPKGSARAMAQAEALRAANTASGPEAAGEYAASFLDPLRFAGVLRRSQSPVLGINSSDFPHVESIEGINVGPTRIKPRVIAEGKPLYRETSVEGLSDYLRLDRQFEAGGGFVTDDPTLAIGQGMNKGVMIKFRPNSLSGEEHIKPGTGVIGGREYRADIIAPRAVEEVVLKTAKDWKRLNALVQRNLSNNFKRVVNEDGSVTFTRVTEK